MLRSTIEKNWPNVYRFIAQREEFGTVPTYGRGAVDLFSALDIGLEKYTIVESTVETDGDKAVVFVDVQYHTKKRRDVYAQKRTGSHGYGKRAVEGDVRVNQPAAERAGNRRMTMKKAACLLLTVLMILGVGCSARVHIPSPPQEAPVDWLAQKPARNHFAAPELSIDGRQAAVRGKCATWSSHRANRSSRRQ